MTCQGTSVVQVISRAVENVEKVDAQSSAFALSSVYWYGLYYTLQVLLCFGNSVASTRFLLQDEFNIQTTQCDNCIIVIPLFSGFMFCLQQVACIFSIVAMIVGSGEIQEASQILSCMSDIVYWT
ncbi:hypothetical protein B296_00025419 [Ensete ventricosum]|uniref:Uncharacterized protein n=1 Tax=Ensete ventricosum TaxID=4639 RepID=A0A426YDT1_ENSVE|nr:hypothetical protein B296_00025419 [Ensete ventricosum]